MDCGRLAGIWRMGRLMGLSWLSAGKWWAVGDGVAAAEGRGVVAGEVPAGMGAATSSAGAG
nr:hypothetical protein KPHV_85630 [Kitasatospora purpeofusca]